jgi:hypothetical protein
LRLDSAFPIAGCSESSGYPTSRPVRLDLATRKALQVALEPAGTTLLLERRDPAGRWTTRVRAHPRDGYLLSGTGFGLFHISPNGAQIRCAPVAIPAWRWQRFLIGQVLPLASTLRGLEPFHAGAVTVGGTAIALIGASGRGKSSLVAELVLQGATFLADDVLVLELEGDTVVAHPGTAVTSLRWVTVERMGQQNVQRLGSCVGSDASSLRVAVPGHDQPVPLAAIYHLGSVGMSRTVRLTPLKAPEPTVLLGNTFVSVLAGRARLVRQLDVCAQIAKSVRMVRVSMPAKSDYAGVARRLLADACP